VGRCGGGAVVLNTIAHSYARLDPPSVRGPGATPRLVREGVQGWWAERDGTGQRAAAARRSSSVSQHPAGSAARRPCLRLPMSLRRHEIHRIVLEEKRQPGNWPHQTRVLNDNGLKFTSHCHLPHTFLTYHSLNFERWPKLGLSLRRGVFEHRLYCAAVLSPTQLHCST
jgi:hypothetical protein